MSKPIPPKIGQPTTEELYLIREEILLPGILDTLQSQYEAMERSFQPLKELYLKAIQLVINLVTEERRGVRQQLRESKIRTWDGKMENEAIYINYNCRGYDGDFFVTTDHGRSEIRVRIGKYIQEAFTPLRERVGPDLTHRA
jgi:hypothetical protein